MELDEPEASPVHLSKRYSPFGVAFNKTELPSLYVPCEGKTSPPSGGFDFTSITNSFVQLESETMKIKRNSFFRRLIYCLINVIKIYDSFIPFFLTELNLDNT